MFSTRTALVAFLCAIACGQSPPTFTAGVSLVHVDVGVTERDGRILTGLSQADFRVLDEGQAQVITGFLSEEHRSILFCCLTSAVVCEFKLRTLPVPRAKHFANYDKVTGLPL